MGWTASLRTRRAGTFSFLNMRRRGERQDGHNLIETLVLGNVRFSERADADMRRSRRLAGACCGISLADSARAETYAFPKYTAQILNLANANAQATRPKVVGQMSKLIEEFPGGDIKAWEQWYAEGHPDAIGNAADRVYAMASSLSSSCRRGPLVIREGVRTAGPRPANRERAPRNRSR